MIKTLQKKFIITAMAAITVLILVLLGTINGVNIWRVHNESDNTMNMLLDTESKNVPSPMDNAEAPENPADMQPPEDMVMAARYFSARVDSDGNIVYVDVSHISSVDEAEAMEYVQQVIGDSAKEGSFENLHYQIRDSADGQGNVIVFLNVSNIRRTILSVLIISIIIGLVGWILMLLIVVGLSKHAIRPIAANKEHMTQLINILMDNAIKYTPEDGHIRFTLHGGHHNCIIKCQNSCETLPDVPAGRLFDRFYRGDSARTQKNGGYGIGLSVAKAIAEMYKGKISAEYVGDGEIIFKVVI